jgi:YHS domain-containing protein/predicted small lipoprotein YifL
MKSILSMAALAIIMGGLAGCGQDKAAETTTPTGTTSAPPTSGSTSATPPTSTTVAVGAPEGSIKVGDKAVCVICAAKEGMTEKEEVKAVIDYKGKAYAFCNESEKAEFISNPAKYAAK